MGLVTNHQKNQSEKHFADDQVVQVLALDGGGLKGLYAAAVIAALEEQLGHSVVRHFDIITGTSTGGLIALGLGTGKSGEDLVNFYTRNGPKVFPATGLAGRARALRSLFACKYSPAELQTTLRTLFEIDGGQPLLRDSTKRLVIPTFYAASSQPRLLKTPHDRRYRSDWKLPIWAVGMATTAAPTFLPGFNFGGNTFLDGGLWANNPSLIGVVEALQMGASLPSVRVLNIGTTMSPARCSDLVTAGQLSWAKCIFDVVTEANSHSTSQMYLRQLLAPGHLAVIDEQIDGGAASLDDINFVEFEGRGRAAGLQAASGLGAYFDHVAPEYVPSLEALAHESQ